MNRYTIILAAAAIFVFSAISVHAQSNSTNEKKQTVLKKQSDKKSNAWIELNGKWVCQAGWMNGQPLPPESVAKISLNLSPGRFVATTRAGEQKGDIELTSTDQQKRLIISQEMNGQKARIKAIYKIENGTMVMAYDSSGDYPTEFKSTAENKYVVLNYARPAKSKPASRELKK